MTTNPESTRDSSSSSGGDSLRSSSPSTDVDLKIFSQDTLPKSTLDIETADPNTTQTLPHLNTTRDSDPTSFEYPGLRPDYEKPTVKVMIFARMIATFRGMLSCIPFILSLFIMGYQVKSQIELNYNKWGTKDPTTGHYIGKFMPFGPAFIVSSIISTLVIWYADCFAFAVITNHTKTVLYSKWLVFSTLTYTIGQCILMTLLQLEYFGAPGSDSTRLSRSLPGYLWPIFCIFFQFYGIQDAYSKILGYPIIGFIARGIFQSLFLVLMLFLYGIYGINLFFSTNNFSIRLVARFVVHPIIQEITLTSWRLLTVWTHNLFINPHNDTSPGNDGETNETNDNAIPTDQPKNPTVWFELLIPQFIFMYSMLGRFLVVANSNFWNSVLLAALLSITDVFIRTSALHRDRSIIRMWHRLRFKDPADSKILKNNVTKLYASWILIDEVSEICGIFIAPFMLLALNFSDSPAGGHYKAFDLITLTVISLLFEFGGDCIKMAYYMNWTPPVWMNPTQLAEFPRNRDGSPRSETLSFEQFGQLAAASTESPIHRLSRQIFGFLGYRTALFWNAIEYAVHEAYLDRHPKSDVIFSFYIWCLGVYIIISVFYSEFIFDYDPLTSSYFIFMSQV